MLLAIVALGCGAKPPCNQVDARGCIIDKFRLIQRSEPGGGGVSSDDVKDALAMTDSSTVVTKTTVDVFGERGTLFFHYTRFDRLVLERDLERVVRYYRSRGFYEARVRAARVIPSGESTVTVEVEVDEGPPTRITKLELELADPSKPLPTEPPDLAAAVSDAKNKLHVGDRFEEADLEHVKRGLLGAMTERGFAYAEVTAHATVDAAAHGAHVVLTISVGPPCTFGEIVIEGLGDLPMEPFYTALRIRRGQRFSSARLESAKAALSELGVLSGVNVEVFHSVPGVPQETKIPVRFLVQPASLRSIQIGGGAELGGRVQTHLVTLWDHKNFLGGLRHLSIGARTGVVFYPLQLTDWNHEVRSLADIRTQIELKQPGFLEPLTSGSVGLEGSFYRPETADTNANASTQRLYENLEVRGTLGVERPFWRSRVRLGALWSGQYLSPIGVWGTPPPVGFDPLFLTYVEARAALDLRTGKDGKRDAIEPHKGMYAGASVQVAGIFPDDGFDVRIQPEVRAYAPLSEDVTLAFRAAAGLLFPVNYGARLLDPKRACASSDAGCQSERARDLQIMQSRGFYSGGTSSNRGYGYNGVNPQDRIASLFVAADQSVPVPIGGRWMWNLSLELRFPIWGAFGASVFADASDVWNGDERREDGTIGPHGFSPHFSPGLGLRYATPIGPARVDLGIRVPCAQHADTCHEYPVALGGQPRPLGLPVYIAIAIGEPF